MRIKDIHIKLTLVVMFASQGISNAQKITDTIFYNRAWQICEKPIAVYYRIGTLMIDSFWYYTGKQMDFDMNGQLLTEAEYSSDGKRDGLFRFYYPDGKLMLSGKYWEGLMIGDWYWYYSNDSLKAIINFDGPSDDFKVIQYKLPDGTSMLENGTGKFEWHTNPYLSMLPNLKVYGSFSAGKRSGGWRYYLVRDDGEESLRFEEKYDKEGKFKRASASGSYYGENPKDRYTDYIFIPPKMLITEQIQYDNFFRRDTAGGTALLNYLLNRRSSEIIVKNKKVENALLQIIRSLESNRGRLEYQQKEIDGSIEFKIGEKGYPEEITVTGKGITEKEKEFIIFLVSKFRDIEMPGVESVAIESYYTINLYSINMKEFMPVSIRDQVNNEMFFTTLPKEKFLILLKSAKKKIKKYAREAFQFYW
ncbi:toxin-antitoxin system YwqK family antitoxin [Terrimonas alba]|uniref:toxin-antitoxin system YwqK family antitoxin n=1 Tax=Terrimonas alba TaxID=3349636 RepID=UPI0035F3D803